MKAQLLSSARAIIWKVAPALFDFLVSPHKGQSFAIGVYSGSSPWSMKNPNFINNPVLCAGDVHDVPAAFVADPFIIRSEKGWCMFMEVFNRINRAGSIGLATSDDCRHWHYREIVISEPFHMAYPHVFESGGNFYMVPDTPGNGVRLYRSVEFPLKWELDTILLDEPGLSDSTIFRWDDTWWMFCGQANTGGVVDTLKLFYASTLQGPWQEHSASPTIKHQERIARPAGRMVLYESQLYRVAQDNWPEYGTSVRAFQVLKLTPDSYAEVELEQPQILGAEDSHWNSKGMHHIDLHELSPGDWIASVDGWH